MAWTDLESVTALEEQIYPDTAWKLETWWAELAQRPRRHYLVAQTGERGGSGPVLVGYAGLDVNGDNADVMTIAVDPAHRGRGVGAALLQRLHTVAAGEGATAVMLEVRADNAAARALYARHGYEHVHTRRCYYQPDGVDAAVLRTALVPEPRKGML
ncbi:MAG: ribosomal protein S18-alanine N-acetyltransferase [Ornithinimicrobium sp.]